MIGQRTDDRGQRRNSQFSILSSQFILSLAIFLLVFLFYFQTRSFEFLRFDDQDYTFLCPFVKDGLSWANVKAAFTSFRHAAIWMPLTYISYMLDISLFGPGMGAHHLVNAAIHAANSVLFYWLLMGIFRGINSLLLRPKIVIVLSTLIWALHPMRVEPVAWIAGRKELLCAFFVLLGLLAVVRRIGYGELRIENCKGDSDDGCRVSNDRTKDKGQRTKDSRTEDKGQRRTFQFSILNSQFSIFLCCVAACMSKPTGMCFPFLAMCVAAMAIRAIRMTGVECRMIGQKTKDRGQMIPGRRTKDRGALPFSQFSILNSQFSISRSQSLQGASPSIPRPTPRATMCARSSRRRSLCAF